MDNIYIKIKSHPLLAALILNGVFFVAAMFLCDQKYETADDFFEDAILSGALSGRSDPHLLYSNIILGYILKALYTVIPGISFYFVFLILLGFASVTAVIFLALRQCCNKQATLICLVISIAFLAFFTDDLYILPQFTKAAAIANTSGGLLFLCGIWNEPGERLNPSIAGIVLIVFGCLLRIDTIYISLPFLLLVFVLEALIKKEKIISRLIMCAGIIALAFALQWANGIIWDADPDYGNFRHMESYRPQITDAHKSYSYEDIKGPLEEIGLDFNDYIMLTTWSFTDRSVFDEDTLQKYIEITQGKDKSNGSRFSELTDTLAEKRYWEYSVFWGLIILIIISIVFFGKGWIRPLSALLMSGLLIASFIIYGRINYRVECSIFLSAACAICYFAGQSEDIRDIKISGKMSGIILSVIAAACVLWHASVYLPDTAYKSMSDEQYLAYTWNTLANSGGYGAQKYNINVSSRRPCESILSVIENDKENYYLFDFNTFLFIGSYNSSPWTRLDTNYFRDNYFYTGGLTMMQFPGQNDVFTYNGIDPKDPFRSLTNGNIYLIDNYFADNKLTYVKEHYDPEAQAELTGDVGGFKVWKIR
ncbi:MAG: hypothetical protein J6Z43_00190 [Clostridiales bacterium]|nr:hypothetical protein [Clostridiales bacterium]